MKKCLIVMVVAAMFLPCFAQERYTLEDCRQMAVSGNKRVQIDQENVEAAKALRKAAMAQFFPKFSANATYTWNQKNISLLAEDALLPVAGVDANGNFTVTDPATQMGNQWTTLPNGVSVPLDASGQPFDPSANPEKIIWKNYAYLPKESMEFDIENIFAAQIGVTQPIFLGGKLRELYRIAKANEAIANIKASNGGNSVTVDVDEAYWRVVSVENKRQLAEQYCKLLKKLSSDVEAMMEEGVATQADVLKVRVKQNEAEMSLAKAENGLALSKMSLCQVCGLPLDKDFTLDDSELNDISLNEDTLNMESVWDKRSEILLLEQAEVIAKSGVRITASQLMPNVVASANYFVSNPNIFNGFDKSFSGMFTAGVVLNVPIAHADDILELKAARHKARTISLQLDEAREKIELQATQSNQQVSEANKKLIRAKSNIANAEENLRLAQESFDAGMVGTTELMQAQTAWLSAHSETIDAAIEAKLCELYLLKNTGRLN